MENGAAAACDGKEKQQNQFAYIALPKKRENIS